MSAIDNAQMSTKMIQSRILVSTFIGDLFIQAVANRAYNLDLLATWTVCTAIPKARGFKIIVLAVLLDFPGNNFSVGETVVLC